MVERLLSVTQPCSEILPPALRVLPLSSLTREPSFPCLQDHRVHLVSVLLALGLCLGLSFFKEAVCDFTAADCGKRDLNR